MTRGLGIGSYKINFKKECITHLDLLLLKIEEDLKIKGKSEYITYFEDSLIKYKDIIPKDELKKFGERYNQIKSDVEASSINLN